MYVPRKMRAIVGALLLSPGLSWAADPGPATSPGPQVVPVQAASDMPPAMMMPPMQAWPQMMPASGMSPYYWAPPPGMMWPIPPQYPVPMAMPSLPHVAWPPFVWVMVPVPAEAAGMAGVVHDPVANTPAVKLPSFDGTAPTPPEGAAQSSGVVEGKVAPPGMPVTNVPESVLQPVVLPTQEKVAEYIPVAPTPVVKLPVPDAAPKAAAEGVVPAASVVEPDKVVRDQAAHAVEVAVPPPASSMAALAVAPVHVPPLPVDVPLSEVVVDYGPVAPTPVVDLLALMQSDSPVVKSPARKTPARLKQSRKHSVAIPLKPRSAATAKPVKPRMCWTKGVVAPCH